MKHITIIAGARPNFMKIAPIIEAIDQTQGKLQYSLVHTGQHYDEKMSESFFEELNIPTPTVNLGCSGGTQAEQTSDIMVEFEKFLFNNPTDLVLVVGDVTSTMACTIVAKKLNIKVAHVEAGIRSNDMTMPEEINRIVTDSISDYFFTTTKNAQNYLINTGQPASNVFFVGNTMIDTLLKFKPHFKKPIWIDDLVADQEYFVMTLHRPANVDRIDNLTKLLNEIAIHTKGLPVIFPIHPRTKKNVDQIQNLPKSIKLVDPLGYLEFNYVVSNSKAVITDSGGITEETTILNIPCMTLRDNTERPETVNEGSNILIGTDPKNLKLPLENLFNNVWKTNTAPELWDGNAASRIIEIILTLHV